MLNILLKLELIDVEQAVKAMPHSSSNSVKVIFLFPKI